MPRRKHSKVAELPQDLRKEIEQLLLAGKTYDDITGILKERGKEIGRSSVGRWGKDFSAKLERINLARSQAEAIAREAGERPATELNEAAETLATQQLFDFLINLPSGAVDEMKLKDVIYGIAALQDSAVRREKLKMVWQDRVRKAADKIEEIGEKAGITPEALKAIKEQVYGIAG